jgi:hypothetical protein
MTAKKKTVRHKNRLLGAYVPIPVLRAVEQWVAANPERTLSTFVRSAAREKLRNDGIPFNERDEVVA